MKVSVLDVAKFILEQKGEMTTWKLQKLVYYSQVWFLVWDEEPLFQEEIQAWANGPVVLFLYDHHKGLFRLTADDIPGDSHNLSDIHKETISKILSTYGNKSGQWLSDLTHMEMPWRKAREGVPKGERGGRVITHSSLVEYYESLEPEEEWQD